LLDRLFEKKSIPDLVAQSTASESAALKPVLGFFDLTSFGVGMIIGAGIFVLTGQAAARYAGPAIVVSFVLSAIACAFSALCYAELAAMIPVAGSAYTYAYATMGRLFAWIIGWCLVLEYLFSASTVAVGWSGYASSFFKDFGVSIPEAWSTAPFAYDAEGWRATGALFNGPAIAIVVVLTIFVLIGVKENARLNHAMVLVKSGVILLFVLFGAAYVNRANWTPFLPPNTGTFGQGGASGIFRGAGVVFFAYIGFDSISCAAQEAKNPQRHLPAAIFASLFISTLFYVSVAAVLTGLVPSDRLDVADPIAVGVDAVGPALFWLRPWIKLGALAALSSVILSSLYGQPRIFYSMAKDGLLPKRFGSIHPTMRTPAFSTVLTGLVAALFAGLFPIEILGELVSIGTLLAFVIVCIGVLVLRSTHPDTPRPFKTPFAPVVSVIGALGALLQMFALPPDTWVRLLVWLAVGALIFVVNERQPRNSSTRH
jgi:APA family basic amino acid/polyamine antiporter